MWAAIMTVAPFIAARKFLALARADSVEEPTVIIPSQRRSKQITVDTVKVAQR
jgi:hypothetical protein